MKKTFRKFTAFVMTILVTGCIFPSSVASANTSEPFAITVDMAQSNGDISPNTTEIAFDLYTATLSSFDPQTGLNQYEETYYDTVSVDISDITTIDRPSACFSISPKLETIPEGYGISTTNIFIQEGTEGAVFTLSLIDNVEVNYDEAQNGQQVTLLNADKEPIFANYSISAEPIPSHTQKNQLLTSESMISTGFVTAGGQNYSYTTSVDLSDKSAAERNNFGRRC